MHVSSEPSLIGRFQAKIDRIVTFLAGPEHRPCGGGTEEHQDQADTAGFPAAKDRAKKQREQTNPQSKFGDVIDQYVDVKWIKDD